MDSTSYFVLKTATYASIANSIRYGFWRTPLKKSPPHTHEILDKAFETSKVVFIIGVSGTKKWQGYATMQSKSTDPSDIPYDHDDKLSAPFKIRWEKTYDKLETGGGLALEKTKDLIYYHEGVEQPLNLSRNGHEIPETAGRIICQLIQEEVDEEQAAKLKRLQEAPPIEHFFTSNNDESEKVWDDFLAEVGKNGKVLFASHIGSRCYNLHTPTSDSDMWVIVCFPTEKMLGIETPNLSIKNKEGFEPDFSLHEDSKMVEALYQDEKSIVYQSSEFLEIRKFREKFLNRNLVRKYMKEVHGPKGFKLVEQLMKESPNDERTHKKFYILLRLLYQAQRLVHNEPYELWMPDSSQERLFLMDVRKCKFSVEELYSIALSRDKDVNESLEKSKLAENSDEMFSFLNNWLLKLRYSSWETPIPKEISPPVFDFAKFPALSSLGDILFLGQVPHSNSLVGTYVENLDKIFSFKKSPKSGEISIENSFLMSEISRTISLLYQGSPNAISPFFLAKPVFETKEWKELTSWKKEFLTTKALHQCIGFVNGLVKSVVRAKVPRPFDYAKAFPVLVVLNEALKIVTNDDRKDVPIAEMENSIVFVNGILDECTKHQIDEKYFPGDVDKEKLEKWLVNIRKLYSPK